MVSLTSSLSSQPRPPAPSAPPPLSHPHSLCLHSSFSAGLRNNFVSGRSFSGDTWLRFKTFTAAQCSCLRAAAALIPSQMSFYSRHLVGASQTASQKGSQSVSQENYTAGEPERQPVSKQILINRSVPLLLANQTLSLGGGGGGGRGDLHTYAEPRAHVHTWVHTPLTLESAAL